MKRFLHVGCGSVEQSALKGFDAAEWQEIRFDIDPTARPHILGSLTDMHAVPSGSVDAVYSSHNLEHVLTHEVQTVLREFHRVLNDDGIVVLTCPDLRSVCEAVVADRLADTLYESPAGPITPLDILYGHTAQIARGKTYMAHRTGFTYKTLTRAFFDAGFRTNFGGARPAYVDLWVVSFKQPKSDAAGAALATPFLP
jgi:SAM-dependent methyltransferase